MGDLLSVVVDRDALEAAWKRISADMEPEVSASITRFAEDAAERIDELAERLISGSYRPGNLTRIEIPKRSGGLRVLDVPRVVDRIVERSILEVVTPFVDPWLGHASFAYRPGLGVSAAVSEVVRLRDEGLTWALRTDVDDCFGTLPRDQAVGELLALLPDDSLAQIVSALTSRLTSTRFGLREVRGVPQGTALSPLLANVVLRGLDEALHDAGHRPVRYADDLVVVCHDDHEARSAHQTARTALKGFGMALGEDKTQIMSFSEGFAFLGEDFGARYPPPNAGQGLGKVVF